MTWLVVVTVIWRAVEHLDLGRAAATCHLLCHRLTVHCGLSLLLCQFRSSIWWGDCFLWLWAGVLLSILAFVGRAAAAATFIFCQRLTVHCGLSLLLCQSRSSIWWGDWFLWLWSGVLLTIWTFVPVHCGISLLLWQRRKEARGSFLIGDNCGSSSYMNCPVHVLWAVTVMTRTPPGIQ